MSSSTTHNKTLEEYIVEIQEIDSNPYIHYTRARVIGSYLWNMYSPMVAFQASSFFGILGAISFFILVKEKKREPPPN